MSSEMAFYIRTGKDNYVCLDSYGRNSTVFEICEEFCPCYDGIKAITQNDLFHFDILVDKKIKKYEKDKASVQGEIDFLKDCRDGFFDDRMEVYRDRIAEMRDLDSFIDDAIYAKHFFYFLSNIIEDKSDSILYYAIEPLDVADSAIVKEERHGM